MSAALAVSRAAKQLQDLLKSANEALDGAARTELEAGQRELQGMQSTLGEAKSHDPRVKRLLSIIEGYACNVRVAIDEDLIEFMARRRSGFERMLFVCSYSDDEDEGEDRIEYVLKNIDAIKDACFALGLAQGLDCLRST